MKKYLSVILALLLALSVSSAAFAAGESWLTPDPQWDIADEDETEDIFERFQMTDKEMANLFTFTTFIPGATANGHVEYDQLSSPLGRAIAKMTGYSQYMYYISGDRDQAMQLHLASDDWEYDTIYGLSPQNKWVGELIDAEVVIPLTKYFNDPENYPWLYAMYDDVKANVTYNGEIYGIPYGWYVDKEPETGEYWRAAGWYINKNIMEQLGYTEDQLKTIEDIHGFAKAIKDAALTTEAGLPVIPISGGAGFSSMNTLANTWGVSTSGYGYDWYDGELIQFRQHENFKESMKWFHDMWTEGLVDAELFSQTNEVLCEKLLAGRIAMIPDVAWPFWSVMTVGHNEASDSMIPIVVPQVAGVEKLGINATYATLGNQIMMVTYNCEDVDGLMKYFDNLARTDSAQLRVTIGEGPRGYRWDCAEDDVSEYWYLDNEWTVESGWDWYAKVGSWHQGIREVPVPFFFNGNQTEIAPNAEDGLTNIFWVQQMHIFNKVNAMDCASRDLDLVVMPTDGAYASNNTLLGQIDLQYLTAAITAEDFEAAWETYQTELEAQAHLSEINEEYKQALAAYQEVNAGASMITELVNK